MEEVTTMVECAICGDHHEECEIVTYDNDGAPVCESCEQQIWNDAIVIQTFTPLDGDYSKVLYAPELDQTMDPQYGDIEEGLPDCLKKAAWESKGHRGSFDIDPGEGYETVLTGWATGNYEDVPWKHAFNNWVDDLVEENITPPFPIHIVYSHTSNVFSIGIDVIIAEDRVDEFKEWLMNETEYTFDQLHQAL